MQLAVQVPQTYSPVQGLYLQGCAYPGVGPMQERQRPCRMQSDSAGRTATVVARTAAAASRSLNRVMRISFLERKGGLFSPQERAVLQRGIRRRLGRRRRAIRGAGAAAIVRRIRVATGHQA